MRGTAFYKIMIIAFCLVVFGCSGKTKEQLYAEGVKEVNDGHPAAAIVFLKNALEKDQNFFDARYQLATAYTSLGRYEQAEKEFRKLSSQNPSYPAIRLGLAKIYNATGKPDLAIKEADEYLGMKPGDAAGLEMMGMSYAVKKQPLQAEDYLQKALKAEPARISAKLELARMHVISGKEQEARALLDEVINEHPKNSRAYYTLAALESSRGNREKALAAYQKITEINPNDYIATYRTGLINLQMGHLDTAEKTADNLQKKFKKKPEGYRLKGIIYYQKKSYAAAITELMNSIKIRPDVQSYYFLGLSLYHHGELENALSQFRKILDRAPSFVQARLLTSIILLNQRRVDDSISETNKVLAIDQNNALAHNLLGCAYMAKGMYDEGMKELNRATEIDPQIIDAYYKKGIFHLGNGQENEAEVDFKTAVRVAPDSLNSRLILSSYYMRCNDSAKALSTLKEGLNRGKSDAVLYNNMAGIAFSEKKPAEGFAYLQKAKAADPAFLASYFNTAIFHAVSGDHAKALKEYRTILQIDPKNAKAMISMGALLELTGQDKGAFKCYSNAVETGNPAAYLALADYHKRKKQMGKALSVLDDAINVIPKNVAALEMKGRICLAEKKYREAMKTFKDLELISPERGLSMQIKTCVLMNDIALATELARRIMALRPNSAYGHMMLAAVYESRKDFARAIDEVQNGIKVEADSVEAHMMLGNLYERTNNPPAAMKAYEAVLRKRSNYAPAYCAQGALLEKQGKKKEAVGKYRDALAKSEQYVPALNNLAYLYADGFGSPAEALRLALTAYRQEPGNPGIMDTLGYALIRNGRKEDSRKALEKAAELLPGNPTVLYHLALSYEELGDRKQAAAKLQKAIQLGEFPELDHAKTLLARFNGTNSSGRLR